MKDGQNYILITLSILLSPQNNRWQTDKRSKWNSRDVIIGFGFDQSYEECRLQMGIKFARVVSQAL